nr:hypothetical protein [Tanacetum cinerariifolium]
MRVAGKLGKRVYRGLAGNGEQCIVYVQYFKGGGDGIVGESGRKCGGEGLQGMAGNMEVGEQCFESWEGQGLKKNTAQSTQISKINYLIGEIIPCSDLSSRNVPASSAKRLVIIIYTDAFLSLPPHRPRLRQELGSWGVWGVMRLAGKLGKRVYRGLARNGEQCTVYVQYFDRGGDGIVGESGKKCGGEGLQGMARNLEVGEQCFESWEGQG